MGVYSVRFSVRFVLDVRFYILKSNMTIKCLSFIKSFVIQYITLITGAIMAKKEVTKKSFGARVNTVLLDKIDKYIEEQNAKGISVKKIDVVETAFIEFLEKRGYLNG